MRAKNVVELLKILHSNSTLLSAIFESNGRQMNINSAIGISDSDTIAFLESYGIIEIFNNEVILNDQIIHMLEAHLIDGYDENLYDYVEIFKKIDASISKYYNTSQNGGDPTRHLRDIQRELQRMPRNLLDTLRGIQRHVEFTYRSASSAQEKLQELTSYNESLLRFEAKLKFIRDELSRFRGFFTHVGDTAILLRRMRLRTYIVDISNTLIQLNSNVVEYIRKTNENIRFYKHLVELKELRDRREIMDKTNLYELIYESQQEPLLNGYATVERPNYTIKLHPDYSYEDEFEQKVLSRGSVSKSIGKIESTNVPIDNSLFIDETIEVLSYAALLDGYVMSDSRQNLLEYIQTSYPDIDDEALLEVYLSAAVFGERYLEFSEEDMQIIATHMCIPAHLKSIH